uniref:Leucine-rich repeats and WD repeat domain containing 1 n=1 Tax=Nothobranchius korthausae TaxID=1143690 RepID=A0A1A8ENG8_9TELE
MSRGGKAPVQPCSILAAGGKRGLVKLIHPRNNVAYGEFRASRKALSVLCFNHNQGNFFFTGSYDNKIIIWSRTRSQRPNKDSRSVCAVVLAELQWASTNIPYLALNTCPGRAYVACGDDKGRIWTYHITSLPKNSFQIGKPIPPTQVLEWPSPTRKGLDQTKGPSINSVAMDPELRYLVAVSDKNMVIVWRRKESS